MTPIGTPNKVFAVTETVEYDLWKNVMSRVELRWDHQAGRLSLPAVLLPRRLNSVATVANDLTAPGGVTGTKHNDYQLMANIIYKF